jgi:hypothetical protein
MLDEEMKINRIGYQNVAITDILCPIFKRSKNPVDSTATIKSINYKAKQFKIRSG